MTAIRTFDGRGHSIFFVKIIEHGKVWEYGSMGVWECGGAANRQPSTKQFESLTLVNIHMYEIHFILFSADFI
jgi:hypothetical protein